LTWSLAITYVSFSAATLHAAERWQGAIGAGDQINSALQLSAYETYSQQASEALATALADNSVLAQALPSVNVPAPRLLRRPPGRAYPPEAEMIANAVNAQCGQPLPSDLNQDLLSLGLLQSTIDSTVCQLVSNITPADINPDFKAFLLETVY
jgi:hypothetical protein